MVFVDFVAVEHFTLILSRFEQTADMYVVCWLNRKIWVRRWFEGCLKDRRNRCRVSDLSEQSTFSAQSESNNACCDAPVSPFGGSRLSAARQSHMLFWCRSRAKSAMGLQAALSPFVNLRSAHLFLRYAYRSGTISASLSALSSNISRHFSVVLENRLFTPFKAQRTQKPQNP